MSNVYRFCSSERAIDVYSSSVDVYIYSPSKYVYSPSIYMSKCVEYKAGPVGRVRGAAPPGCPGKEGPGVLSSPSQGLS